MWSPKWWGRMKHHAIVYRLKPYIENDSITGFPTRECLLALNECLPYIRSIVCPSDKILKTRILFYFESRIEFVEFMRSAGNCQFEQIPMVRHSSPTEYQLMQWMKVPKGQSFHEQHLHFMDTFTSFTDQLKEVDVERADLDRTLYRAAKDSLSYAMALIGMQGY